MNGSARAYAGRGVDVDDLVQDGVVGLLRPLPRFDPERGVPFGAYARHWVRQAMQQAVAGGMRPYRLPTHVLTKPSQRRTRAVVVPTPAQVEEHVAPSWRPVAGATRR